MPSPRRAEWRLRIAQFGDGYQQRTLDGINALNLTWSLTWELRKMDEVLAMDAYLTAAKGEAFIFLDPISGETFRVFCDRWQADLAVRRRHHGQTEYWATLSAEFVKANGVSI